MCTGIFKTIDIFGITFNFTTFGKEKFKTNLGSLMTIICVVIIGVFTFLFGQNFYYRENPSVINQIVVPDNYSEPFNITNKNLFFAWRVTRLPSQETNYNYTGTFFPMLGYIHYDNINNKNIRTEILESVPCSTPDLFDKEFAKSYNPETWMCINWKKYNNELKLGGGFDGKEAGYFFFRLSSCADPIYTNTSISSGRCKEIDALKSELGKAVYVHFVYPEYNFSPENYDKPLKRIYKNYFYRLDFYLRKLERLFIEEVKLSDDRGWIFEDKNVTKLNSAKEKQTDLYFFKDEDYGKPGMNSAIYAMVIYATKPYTYITRSYMKIQDLAAIVGGFAKSILLFGMLISKFFGVYMRNEMFYNVLFDNEIQCENEENKRNNVASKIEINNYFKPNENNDEKVVNFDESNTNQRIITKKENNTLNFLNRENHVPSNDKISSSKPINPIAPENQIENNRRSSTKNFGGAGNSKNRINIINPNDSSIQQKNKSDLKLIKKTKAEFNKKHSTSNVRFGMWRMIKHNCMKRKTSNLSIVDNYLKEKLDVQSYLKNIEILDRLRKLLLTKEENIVFKYMKKPNITVPEDLESLKINNSDNTKEIENLIDYMKEKINNKTFNEKDKCLIDMVDKKIKNLIV